MVVVHFSKVTLTATNERRRTTAYTAAAAVCVCCKEGERMKAESVNTIK